MFRQSIEARLQNKLVISKMQLSKSMFVPHTPFRLRTSKSTFTQQFSRTFMQNKCVTQPDQRRKHQSTHFKQISKDRRFLIEDQAHSWYRKRGKDKLQSFKEQQIAGLKRIFKVLDDTGSKSLLPKQIYQPFISLDIVSSLEELQALLKNFDQNRNGYIQFREFLKIAKTSLEGKANTRIKQFFATLLTNAHRKRQSFVLLYNKRRRDTLMEGLRNSSKMPQLLRKVAVFKTIDKLNPQPKE